MYSQFESMNNQSVCELDARWRKRNEELTQFETPGRDDCFDDKRERQMLHTPFEVNGSCAPIDTDYSLNKWCYGYACDKGNNFYHQPEKLNTYHNYLVLEEGGKKECTKNHQYFNNWTKRNSDTKQHVERMPLTFGDAEPIPMVTMRNCVDPYGST